MVRSRREGALALRQRVLKLFLCGDVMLGRGVDQILPSPGAAAIHEPWMKSALDYVRLAEESCGPIPRCVRPGEIWGDALEELERQQPNARIVNLETAVTTSKERASKGIHYRMNPPNAACLSAARIDCCVLANNHVLDWGRGGLLETLDTLRALGISTAGAGRNAERARAPAALDMGHGRRLLVFAAGFESAGVPSDWAAADSVAGVSWLPEPCPQAADELAARILSARRPGDLVLLSVHWGSNWGYQVPHSQRAFARRLVDAKAIDLLYGHSSHHPRPLEVYRDRLILYGCGDFINDYEGISGYEAFRPELTLMYFPTLEASSGKLLDLHLTPMRLRCFRPTRARDEEARWLAASLGLRYVNTSALVPPTMAS